MLYFAYASNLNHEQMQRRCKDSMYIRNFFVKDYDLSFCSLDKSYGVANIMKKLNSKVPGAIWNISVTDEIKLDYYEGFPINYLKDFFYFKGEKVMFYFMKSPHSFKSPLRQYIDVINQGYKDCDLDNDYLKNILRNYTIEL